MLNMGDIVDENRILKHTQFGASLFTNFTRPRLGGASVSGRDH